jgi:hypothetical protein
LHTETTFKLIRRLIQGQGHGLYAGDRMKDDDSTFMNSISNGDAIVANLLFIHGWNPLLDSLAVKTTADLSHTGTS